MRVPMHGAGFLLLALLIFAPLNAVAIRQLLRLHPRRRRIVVALAMAGNALWPFFLVLGQLTPFTRTIRAVLGPPWFAWQSFTVVYTGLTILMLLLPARWRVIVSRTFLWMTIAGSIAGMYQALVPLRIARVPLFIDGLPAAAVGTKLALLADLHVGLFTRPARLAKIFRTVDALSPDAVLLAGDLVDDDPFFVPKLLTGTRPLPSSIPLVAVLGNHEMYGNAWSAIAQLRGSRIRLLVNEGFAFRSLWIAGISDPAGQAPALRPDMARALAARPPGAMPVVLSHQPKSFAESRRRGVPLTLSAHTHGGQLGARPLGWSLAGLFLDYDMGSYRAGASQLYINTGTGYWLVPFRLGMTPEITLIELRRER